MNSRTPVSGDFTDRFLNVALLKPGDVLLTYPSGPLPETWESDVIARLTGGRYSHAILVLEPTRWYESNDLGVGPISVTVDRIEIGDVGVRMMKSLRQWKHFDVFRRDGLQPDTESFKTTLQRITDRLSYKRYPSYDRIARDLRVLEWLPLRDTLARLFSDNRLPEYNRGFFCSEVIAHVYKELGFGFVSRRHDLSFQFANKNPEQVRPSDIADCEVSGMSKISDADEMYRSVDDKADTVPTGLLNCIASFGGSEAVHLRTTLKTAADFFSTWISNIALQVLPSFKSALENEFDLRHSSLEIVVAMGKTLSLRLPNIASTWEDAVEAFGLALEGLDLSRTHLAELAEAYGELRRLDDALCDSLKENCRQMFEISISSDERILRVAHEVLNEFDKADLSQLPPTALPSATSFVEQTKELRHILGANKDSKFTTWLVIYPDWPLKVEPSTIRQFPANASPMP